MNTIIENLKEKLEAGPPTEGLLALKKELEKIGLYVSADDPTGEINDFWPYSMIVLPSEKTIPYFKNGNAMTHLEIAANGKNAFNVTLFHDGQDSGEPPTYKSIKNVLASKEMEAIIYAAKGRPAVLRHRKKFQR